QNIVALAAFVVAWGVAGGFADPRSLTLEQQDHAARIVAFGFLAGGIAMFLLQIPALGKERMLVAPRLDPRGSEFREVLAKLFPVLASMGVVQVSVLFSSMLAFAILDEGGNVHLDYAARIFQLPQGLVGSAVATAAFPNLSRAWAESRMDRVGSELDRSI